MRKPLARDNRGFTLIELLVVIAIIAILAAILFPVFGRARENARRSTCQSNLKQLGLGILQYVQDYDERFPGFAGWGGGGGWASTTNPIIYPYLKSSQILTCPSAKADGQVSYALNSFTGCAPVTGYVNPGAVIRGGSNCQGPGLAQSGAPLPAQTIMAFETTNAYYPTDGSWVVYNQNYDYTGTGCTGYAWQACYFGVDTVKFRKLHLDGSNLSFLDGHVKWYSEAKLNSLGNGAIAFAGHKNGTGPGSNIYNTYKHNGDIDMQPATSTQWDP